MRHLLLVDDHKTFLAGTALILEKHGFHVTTSSRGTEALELMEKHPFDLFVFDLKLPGMNGFELTEETLRRDPEAIIVILTGEDIAEHYDKLIDLGATGMLEKSLGEQEFIQCIHLAMHHQRFPPAPRKEAANERRLRWNPACGIRCRNKSLSDKEVEILKLIAQGKKNKDIADRLFMSQRNVEYTISRLFEKLGAASRQEAVMKGIEQNWLSLEP